MAVGVQAVMDLVPKVSTVVAQPSPPSPGPRVAAPVLVHACISAALSPASPSCWHIGLKSQALELASTICALINLFHLTIFYQPERITMQ